MGTPLGPKYTPYTYPEPQSLSPKHYVYYITTWTLSLKVFEGLCLRLHSASDSGSV